MKYLRIATLGVSLIIIVATFYTGLITFRGDKNVGDDRAATLVHALNSLNYRIDHLEAENQELKQQLNELQTATQGNGKGVSLEVSHLGSKQASLDRRMTDLEQSLLSTPATSLAVPMLRKDMDVLRDRFQAAELTNKELSHNSEEKTKWIFGLVAAALTGVMAQWFGARFKAALDKPKA